MGARTDGSQAIFAHWLKRLAVAATCALSIAAGKPAAPPPGQPAAMEVKADVALLVDATSGAVLFEKNADKPFVPASLTKMMTVAVTAREIKEGRLSLDGEFTVSEHAWRTGGAPSRTSAMFAPVHSKVRIDDLLHGVMIQSANDGAIALAEGIAGTEQAFAEVMNRQAAELGMKATRFGNPSGLPGADNVTTARDLVILARTLVEQYPDIYKIYAKREFTYNKIRQLNRNPLLDAGVGADGLKTGFLKESGYNLVGSAVQGTQRLFVVIGGAPSDKERAEDSRKLIDWGFRTFESFRIYKKGETIGEASVFGGLRTSVKIAAPRDVDVLIQRGSRDKLRARVVYSGPIRAPIAEGRPVGRLIVTRNEQVVQEFPVVAAEDMPVGSLGRRALDGTRELLIGLLRR